MNEEKILRELSRMSRSDTPPDIDVVQRVRGEIIELDEPLSVGIMWTFAATAAVAATVVATFAIRAILAEPDPVAQFIGAMMRGA